MAALAHNLLKMVRKPEPPCRPSRSGSGGSCRDYGATEHFGRCSAELFPHSPSIFQGRLGWVRASDLRLVEPDGTTADFFNTPLAPPLTTGGNYDNYSRESTKGEGHGEPATDQGSQADRHRELQGHQAAQGTPPKVWVEYEGGYWRNWTKGVILKTNYPGLLSWEETYRAMAAEGEDWSDFEGTAGDGLE